MKDWFLKLWILFVCLYDGITGGYQYWKTEIKPKGLDDWVCCNGGTGSHDICGCGGETLRDQWFKK